MSAEHPADQPARAPEMDRYRFRRQRNLYSDASIYKRAGKPTKLISDEDRRGRLHRSFCMFDRNTYTGEGRVTRQEMLEIGAFMRAEAGFTEEQNKSVVEAMDENNDGIITFKEFLTFNKDVLYELTDEEFERVDKRFSRLAKEAQAARAGQGDPLDDSDWYMFGSENSAIQALRRQRNQRSTGTTPPRRSGLTEYEKRKLVRSGELPPKGTRNLGPRRTGYAQGEEELPANRVWMPNTPIPRGSDCYTELPKRASSREVRSGFDESFSEWRLRPGSAPPEPRGPEWAPIADNEHHLRKLTGPPAAEAVAIEEAPRDPHVYGWRQPHTNFTVEEDKGPVFVPIVSKGTADVLAESAWLDHTRGKIKDFQLTDMARPTQFHGRIEEGPPHQMPRWVTGRSAQF